MTLEEKRDFIECIRRIIRALGDDPDRPGLRDTPERTLQTLFELTRGLREKEPEFRHFKLERDMRYGGLIIVRDIKFTSLCEHHLMPIIGTASIAFTPIDDEVPGLSKIIRYVKWAAARLVLQERLTMDIAKGLIERIRASFVYVKLCALHFCILIRGVNDDLACMITEYWLGKPPMPITEIRSIVKCKMPRIVFSGEA